MEQQYITRWVPNLPHIEDTSAMAEIRFTAEKVINIYDDETGNHFYVGPDADGLDGIEIRDVDGKTGTIDARFFMGREQAVMVARAILELYGNEK